jgi:hypothetical protein
MKSRRRKLEEQRASEASHGRILALTISHLKSRIAQLRRDLAKERNEHAKRRLVRELDSLVPVLAQREAEYANALKVAEAERTM